MMAKVGRKNHKPKFNWPTTKGVDGYPMPPPKSRNKGNDDEN